MNDLHALGGQMDFSLQTTPRLAWRILRFPWQRIAVAVVLALTLRLGRIRHFTARYAFSLVALLTMAAYQVEMTSAAPPVPTPSFEPAATATYRGRVITEDGSPLPKNLKLFRRVSYEPTKETPIDSNGEFSFQTDPDRSSVRFSMTAAGFAPFDSKWMKLNQPIKLTLSRGASVNLHLVAPAGNGRVSGSVTLIVPWWDDDEQGTFPVDVSGVVTIAHCPLTTVKLDILVPGFEEVRVQRLVRRDLSVDVPLQVAKPATLRIVSAEDGHPIAGAKIRLFSRTRAGSFLMPFRHYGEGPIWGESDADGRAELTTLRALDPVPSNDPGAAIYAFRIDAPNHAPHYIGNIRAGSDLGDIQLGAELEVRGEIVRDPEKPERVSLQLRQPTVAQGGDGGRGGWRDVDPVEKEGKLTFHLTGLQAGLFDMFIVYSDASERPGSTSRTFSQMQFHGMLTGNSSNLVITRKSVIPGDKNLKARRNSLLPIDDRPPSNVPQDVVAQFVAGWQTADQAGDQTTLQLTQPALDPLFVWSSTAPVQHSMGHVDWRVFILRDGTVFVPGGMNRDAGTHHKLAAAELQELEHLLEKHHNLFGKQMPTELPKFAGWRHGHETLSYTKDGKTQSFTRWYGLEEPPIVGDTSTAEPHKEITEFVSRLIANAECGGREAREKYRELANRALISAIPTAEPFPEDGWISATNRTDGTREITFASTKDRTNVSLIHPAFGDVYVERIERLGKRVAFVSLNEIGTPESVRTQNSRTERQTQPKLGTLTGRFVYLGQPPVMKDYYPELSKLDVSQAEPPNPDRRPSGVEFIYRTFLGHKIRPKTQNASLLVGEDGGIANVMVWVLSKDVPWAPPQGGLPPVTIRLKDGNYSSRITAVAVGQPLLIKNDDPVAFNFQAEFRRPLNTDVNVMVRPGSMERLTFRDPESYPTPYHGFWSGGRLFVHSNSFVAISRPDGSFTLPNLPLGEWEFRVWHENSGYVQRWPKGQFKQTIKPGENSLGTIELKPELFGRKAPDRTAKTPPPQNREQIGEVLGKPVYRDEVQGDTVHKVFLAPLWQKYRESHQAAIAPTEDELKFAEEVFNKKHRERIESQGGEAEKRERMKAIVERLGRRNLSEEEVEQLELEHHRLEAQLKPPGRLFAEFMLKNWKFQKHLYDNYGGGRVLWQQAGLEAFDATRKWMEEQEKNGQFKITDPQLHAKLFEYWTRKNHPGMLDDEDVIRRTFVEPEWIDPG